MTRDQTLGSCGVRLAPSISRVYHPLVRSKAGQAHGQDFLKSQVVDTYFVGIYGQAEPSVSRGK